MEPESDVSHVSEDAKQPASPVKGFLILSRIPFLSPGLAALVTGIVIALEGEFHAEWGLVWMSIGGMALIMLATYYFNEYYDYEGDVINRSYIAFSGGSRALPDKMVDRSVAKFAGLSALAILVVIAALYLLFYFEDYPLLLPLALFGAFCGVFYSHPPIQLAYQGIGEIVIGGCYGILALTSGYYLVSGVMEPDMILVAIPASLSVFCVIVANEFPDYDADKAVNKRNLVVRLGLKRGSVVYVLAMVLIYPMMVASVLVGISSWIVVMGLPVLLLSAVAIVPTLRGGYAIPGSQMKISGATLLVNLLSSLLFIPVVLLW
jgi:1,4-dihydroxy-2-naphthoate octaprenyltransferase